MFIAASCFIIPVFKEVVMRTLHDKALFSYINYFAFMWHHFYHQIKFLKSVTNSTCQSFSGKNHPQKNVCSYISLWKRLWDQYEAVGVRQTVFCHMTPVLWPLLTDSCMSYLCQRGLKLSASKWNTQTDVHDLLIWLSQLRGFFSSPDSLDTGWTTHCSNMSQYNCVFKPEKMVDHPE